MSEYLYNIYDEEVEVTKTKNNTIVKFEDGTIKTCDDYYEAIGRLYRMGYRF